MPELPVTRYRVTRIFGDNVLPPDVPGAVAYQHTVSQRAIADQEVEISAADSYIGRILLEQERVTDVTTQKAEWVTVHSWIRVGGGWVLEHGQPIAGDRGEAGA